MRRRFLVALAAAGVLWLTDGHGQTPPAAAASAPVETLDCLPQAPLVPASLATGSRVVERKGALGGLGNWRYMWCPTLSAGVYADGKPKGWTLHRHVCLARYCALNSGTLTDALWDVLRSPAPITALQALVTSGTVVPVDPVDVYNYARLRYDACMDAYTPPYIIDITPPSATPCGPGPKPPGAAVGAWQTPATGSGTLFTTANGLLTGVVIGRKAPPLTLADCALARVAVGAKVYCALSGGVKTEVTEVTQVPPP